MDCLLVYASEHPKIRMGSNNDGGYVICDGISYDLLLSCGISDDINFEIEFTIKYNCECYAYDGTIDNLPPTNNDKITFIKKNISTNETETTTTMLNIIDTMDNIFLKMDIETWEYHWINLLNTSQLNKLKQIVIEFHFPFTYSEDIFRPRSYPLEVEEKMKCLKKLSDTHYLLHFHCNNCCGTTTYNDILVPNVFECTYVRKDLCNHISRNTIKIPGELDRPNLPWNDDIKIEGYPFTL